MFLKYLSGQDCEERYWPFVFRFETLVAGVVLEASKRCDSMTDEQLETFFSNVYAGALDENSGITPPAWWARVEPPSYAWFKVYLTRELPFMIQEARRQAEERKKMPQNAEETTKTTSDPFDKAKARHCAHVSSVFASFLKEG